MSSPILARADALMHRRRPGSQEADDIPVLTDAVAGSDEIPTLLADEPPLAAAAMADEVAPEDSGDPDAAHFDSLAAELARRVHVRLAAELPAIVDDCLRELLADPGIASRLRAHD